MFKIKHLKKKGEEDPNYFPCAIKKKVHGNFCKLFL